MPQGPRLYVRKWSSFPHSLYPEHWPRESSFMATFWICLKEKSRVGRSLSALQGYGPGRGQQRQPRLPLATLAVSGSPCESPWQLLLPFSREGARLTSAGLPETICSCLHAFKMRIKAFQQRLSWETLCMKCFPFHGSVSLGI